jgi:hypothetical protein
MWVRAARASTMGGRMTKHPVTGARVPTAAGELAAAAAQHHQFRATDGEGEA